LLQRNDKIEEIEEDSVGIVVSETLGRRRSFEIEVFVNVNKVICLKDVSISGILKLELINKI
jgi:hypothetical protein